MYLILSTPSLEYAQAVSHELWMLARPRSYSDNETSQYYCGWFAHPDGNQVAIGPIDGLHNVHKNADETSFGDLVQAAITVEEKSAIEQVINSHKGKKVSIIDVISTSPSLAPNLISKEEMQTAGWFSSEELI